MRKITLFFVAFAFIASTGFSKSMAVSPLTTAPAVEAPAKPVTKVDANKLMVPVGKSGKKISLKELSTISKSDLEALTGKKMSFVERIAFKKTQKRLSKGIDENGYVTDKKLNKVFLSKKAGESGFHLGGFALGFFLGLIGVLLAYVAFDDDYKSNRIKWSWIGCAAAVVLWVVLVVAVFAAAASTIP